MDLRHEAVLMLENRGTVLHAARIVSRILRENNIRGAVIGGIAVFLHGYLRTTRDVNVFVPPPVERFAGAMTTAGATFDAACGEYFLNGVPVQIVSEDLAAPAPGEPIDVDGVTTVSLPDLISLKLHSGTSNVARAQDIAGVVGLIRRHDLSGPFVPKLHKSVRKGFRNLLKALDPPR
jgi:hypothetical protein